MAVKLQQHAVLGLVGYSGHTYCVYSSYIVCICGGCCLPANKHGHDDHRSGSLCLPELLDTTQKGQMSQPGHVTECQNHTHSFISETWAVSRHTKWSVVMRHKLCSKKSTQLS